MLVFVFNWYQEENVPPFFFMPPNSSFFQAKNEWRLGVENSSTYFLQEVPVQWNLV